MKIRNPKTRFDLNIKHGSRVLEVGGGHNPHPKANVVVDKYTDTNFHRSGDIKVLKHQQFLNADGENLPFKDKEFDYVICCQVLEHVENPVKFLSEQFRVAKKGYIEVPSLIGEYLFPRESHKWILHEYKDVLYLVDKKKLNFVYGYDLGELIQDYLPKHSIGFKILERTHPNMETIRIEWENDFHYVLEPTDPEVLQFFKGKWKLEWADMFFPKKSLSQEFSETIRALTNISKSVFKSRFLKK
ncbi:MAG TPA: methyltransferase domain-containing protein [Flavisolibacter sp.]|nr:methyltransferase domain-containing protein [Flavisolibacter sp.]